MIELVEDIICIILLVLLPDILLEKFGLYAAMYALIEEREENSGADE